MWANGGRGGGEQGRRKKGKVFCLQECLLRGIYPDPGNKTKTCLKNGTKIKQFLGLLSFHANLYTCIEDLLTKVMVRLFWRPQKWIHQIHLRTIQGQNCPGTKSGWTWIIFCQKNIISLESLGFKGLYSCKAIPIKCFVSHRPPFCEGGPVGWAKKKKENEHMIAY